MSTTMGACFGGCTGLLVMLIYTRLTTGHAMWDLTMSTNGALTGMVVSSTDSNFVSFHIFDQVSFPGIERI